METLRNLVNASDINAIMMDEFLSWPHFVQPDSPFRAYFGLLLDRGVVPAIYLEGVRQANNLLTVAHGLTLLSSVSPFDPYACFANGLFLTLIYLEGVRQANNFLTVAHGLTLLSSVSPFNPYACFANGLFLTCTGNHVGFLPISDMFWEMTPTFEAAHAVAELVMYHISQLHTEGPRLSQRSWSILINYLPVTQTPIETLRNLVNASDINAIVMDEFLSWPHFVQPDSPIRAYFGLLLDRGAVPAIYLEGVRQANNFLTVAHGLTLLNSVSPFDPYACFANGLFLTSSFTPKDLVSGNVRRGLSTLQPVLTAARTVNAAEGVSSTGTRGRCVSSTRFDIAITNEA
ncbi:hypothetical protein ISN45_Aa08g009130 [Arabidopsis thaliana x Arabidopsis arenosa]|uniref:Uncharacterized protein n=1 Tax=Arabidopsis thaliana x Arabidopsis arenosa TaxID=1240361 RepID=A0A8T1XHK1_9BRAS|nr:hypothetical protein ISN45_Aa08g009130 [Arabidopsis thaliana x Arabidopsis arenosa]